jgi:peptidoglycan/LPS O-acetylase OafA/YrhL
VLLTLIYHTWTQLPGYPQLGRSTYNYAINYGRTGVHLFFVLSGFLLFQPYARWLLRLGPRPSALLFYKRRILRVGPAYWASLTLLLLAGPLTAFMLVNAAAHALFIFNAFPATAYGFNSVFWTMAVEVQFYAILPLLGLCAHLLSRLISPPLAAALLVLGMIAASLGETELAQVKPLTGHPILATVLFADTSLPYWLQVFAGGIACSVVYTYLTGVRPRLAAAPVVRMSALLLFLGGVAGGLALAFLPAGRALSAKNLLFGVCYGALLLGVLFGPTMVGRPFAARPVRFVGLISYSLYIWHTVVLAALLPLQLAVTTVQAQVLVGVALGLPLSLMVAYVSFQLTERPFFAARKRAHEGGRQPR